MGFTFREGVHSVRSGDQVVVLDEHANRYLALTRRQEDVLLSGNENPGDLKVLAPLLRRGLLTAADRFTADLSPACAPPQASILEGAGVQAWGLRDLLCVLRAFRVAERHIATKRLAGILAMQRQVPPSILQQSAVDALAWRFLSSRPWVPWTPICLLDSVALLRFLGANGIDAQLVVGVRTRPFEAHCWVERNSVALNETVLRARSFTPIVIA